MLNRVSLGWLQFITLFCYVLLGGAVASWLVHWTPQRAVRVRALAGDIVFCSWARHFTLTVPLSTQVYKWVPANCWGNLTYCGEVTCDGLASRPGEVEILLAASCYRNRDKHRQLHVWVSLGSKASLMFYWSFRLMQIASIPDFHFSIVQSNLRLRPPLLKDQFTKSFQVKSLYLERLVTASRKRPRLFLELKFDFLLWKVFILFLNSRWRPLDR